MFIDAVYDRKADRIKVSERIDGKRILSDHPCNHVFYYSHPSGTCRSIFETPCRKFSSTNKKKFDKELMERKAKGHQIFESDINPLFRFLEDNYKGANSPNPNIGFFDIETDFDPDKGFADPSDPFNPVTAISIYLSHLDHLVTLVLCPPTISYSDGTDIVNQFSNTYLFDNEVDLLNMFLGLIEEVDVLSGWNSTFYDIPYIVNRIKKIIDDKETSKLCLWGYRPREQVLKKKFGKKTQTYDLVGRIHLDYLALYQKHNTQQLQSYRLDYVAEIEIGENKVPYEGTLDDLYKKDFPKFIEYNRQDTMLLHKLDQKLKYIELANQISHANCVPLKTTMGSVSLVEAAIINEMHAMGFVVPDKPKDATSFFEDDEEDEDEEKTPVVGAYVAKPRVGLNEHVGCIDVKSLYPSAIRAMNMSPETLHAQIRSDETMALIAQRIASGIDRAEAWDGIFATLEVTHVMERDDALLTIDFQEGQNAGMSITMTGAEAHEYIFSQDLCITANGTIFRTDKEGIIPQLLEKWYDERKTMQKSQKEFAELSKGIEISAELAALLR